MKLYDMGIIAIAVVCIVVSAISVIDNVLTHTDTSINININIEEKKDASPKNKRWVQIGNKRKSLPYQSTGGPAG